MNANLIFKWLRDPRVNGGAKTGHRAEQKSANLGVEGALAAALPI